MIKNPALTKNKTLVGGILLMLLMLPITAYLAINKNSKAINSKAYTNEIVFVDDSNQPISTTSSPTVRVKLSSPFTASNVSQNNQSKKGFSLIKGVSAQSSSYSILSFTLINADTDRDIKTLNEGELVNLSTLPTKNLSIRTNTVPQYVGSVKFVDNGKSFVDNTYPYAIAGDSKGNYVAWTPNIGSHSLTAAIFSKNKGSGTLQAQKTINFSVANSNITPSSIITESPSPTLSMSPSLSPSPINQPITTKEVTLAEDYLFTKNVSGPIPYTSQPFYTTYTFSNTTAGPKSLYVKFTSMNGEEKIISTTIELTNNEPIVTTLEAEKGIITAPMLTDGGNTMIYQDSTNTVTPSSNGKAEYTFSVPESGNYIIKGMVNARTTSNDSFYINIDSEPTSLMIWDIYPLTTGFQERTVSWRGTGTPDNNQFAPKIFALTAGSHKLIIRGRDGYTYLDKIYIVKTSAATPPVSPSQSPTPSTGLRTYWHGVNYAWWYFGRDFGNDNDFGQGVRELYTTHDQNLAKISQNGGKVVRWFMFPDYDAKKTIVAGQPPSPEVIDDIKAAVELAKKHDLYLLFVFISFPEFNYLLDETYTSNLVQNTFTPILQQFGNDPNILAWDALNEADWSVSENPTVNLPAFQRYARQMERAVHTNTNHKFTISGGTILYRQYYKGLGLDFYDFHRYNNDQNYPTMDAYAQNASDLGMDKPVILGEIQDLESNVLLPYEKAWSLGYAGALGWCSNNDYLRCDPDGKHRIDWPNFKAFADDHHSQWQVKP